MDTEEEGALYVGCAGGEGVNIDLALRFEPMPAGYRVFQIKLHGLRGGHSGVDIHLQRGNAVKLLARVLNAVGHSVDFRLASLTGGNMHNAIPREAFAVVAVSDATAAEFEKQLQQQVSAIKAEFKPADPDIKLSMEKDGTAVDVLLADIADTVLNLLNALPHGVIAMSYDIPELVETSSNLATVRIDNSIFKIHVSNRSSVDSAIKAIQNRVMSIGNLAGAKVEALEGYPGWKPNLESHVLQVAKQAHKELLGKEPEIKAVHAGLECGIIGEKYPGIDMVSLGPQIEFPHSPGERVKIRSVADFYRLLSGILERLA